LSLDHLNFLDKGFIPTSFIPCHFFLEKGKLYPITFCWFGVEINNYLNYQITPTYHVTRRTFDLSNKKTFDRQQMLTGNIMVHRYGLGSICGVGAPPGRHCRDAIR
jgi:hypothetical protein